MARQILAPRNTTTLRGSEYLKARAFIARNQQFPDALRKLLETSNKCFGRHLSPKSHLEDICFGLGDTCRRDFLEVVFLAMGGYGSGETKILRSLYERAVTVDYLIQNPPRSTDSCSSPQSRRKDSWMPH